MAAPSIRTNRLRPLLIAAVLAASLLPTTSALASHTPNPTSVTVAGSLQQEAGCPGDWDASLRDDPPDLRRERRRLAGHVQPCPPAATSTRRHSTTPGTRTTGSTPSRQRRQHPAQPAIDVTNVKFYYDHKSHWITDNQGSTIAVAPGSFQSELGCSGDWDPGCLRSWLQDIDGDGIYTFETTALPAGSYEGKVAINESWDENYGAGGAPNGSNIAFTVPSNGTKVTFTYDATTHVLTIEVAVDHGAPGGPGALSHFDLARKDCLGTARNTESKVWYTVAGGMLSDVYYPTVDNTNVETLQYIVTDGATFTDLQARDMTYTVQAVTDTGGMACKVTASDKDGLYSIETTYVTDPSRNAVLMRLAFTPKPKPNSPACSCSSASTRPSTAMAAAARAMAGRTRQPSTTRAAIRSSWPPTRSPRPTPPTGITPSRSSPRSTARSTRLPSGSPARRATGSSSSTTPTR